MRQAIELAFAQLSAQQRRVAQYLLAHQATAFGLSVHELARAADVSEATVVRFAKQVGYSGYLELRAALTGEAKADLSPARRFAARPPRPSSGTLEEVAEAELRNLRAAVDEVDRAALAQLCRRLRGAVHVGTMGLGVSSICARMAAYSLSQVGIRSAYLARETLSLPEQVALLPARAAVWAFAFPPYSRETVAAARQARSRGLAVVAITDGVASPLREHAHATLYARGENLLFTNNISATLLLVNAIVTDLALTDKRRALAQLRALEAAGADDVIEAGDS